MSDHEPVPHDEPDERSRDETPGPAEQPTCANCGHPIEADDITCPNCGISLVAG